MFQQALNIIVIVTDSLSLWLSKKMPQQTLNVIVIVTNSLSLWLSKRMFQQTLNVMTSYITTKAFVVSSSFKANFDINNRVTLTSNFMTSVQHVVATNHYVILTRRRNEIFLRSWRFWSIMHNRKKKKEEKKKHLSWLSAVLKRE